MSERYLSCMGGTSVLGEVPELSERNLICMRKYLTWPQCQASAKFRATNPVKRKKSFQIELRHNLKNGSSVYFSCEGSACGGHLGAEAELIVQIYTASFPNHNINHFHTRVDMKIPLQFS